MLHYEIYRREHSTFVFADGTSQLVGTETEEKDSIKGGHSFYLGLELSTYTYHDNNR